MICCGFGLRLLLGLRFRFAAGFWVNFEVFVYRTLEYVELVFEVFGFIVLLIGLFLGLRLRITHLKVCCLEPVLLSFAFSLFF